MESKHLCLASKEKSKIRSFNRFSWRHPSSASLPIRLGVPVAMFTLRDSKSLRCSSTLKCLAKSFATLQPYNEFHLQYRPDVLMRQRNTLSLISQLLQGLGTSPSKCMHAIGTPQDPIAVKATRLFMQSILLVRKIRRSKFPLPLHEGSLKQEWRVIVSLPCC